MTTYLMVFWIAMRLWPLAACDQTVVPEPQKEEKPAACTSGEDMQGMQAKVAALEARVVAMEQRLAALEQTGRIAQPPIYIPPPSIPGPYAPYPPIAPHIQPMPTYPGWGLHQPNNGQLPPGWQIREFNGQNYYMVPVNGAQ